MGKQKAKKSPSAKPPDPPDPSPPPRSSDPISFQPAAEEERPPSPVSEEVSDAHCSFPAEVDAQLPLISVDLSLQTAKKNPSDMPEIVAQVTDPAPEEVSLAEKVDELSLMAMPTSSSVTTVGAIVVAPTLASAHPAEQLADAVAMEAPLSSQKADAMPPPINFNGDKGGSNSAGASHNAPAPMVSQDVPVIAPIRAADSWCDRAKGVKQLSRKGEAFILPSGEACVKIPNSVIEKNRKA